MGKKKKKPGELVPLRTPAKYTALELLQDLLADVGNIKHLAVVTVDTNGKLSPHYTNMDAETILMSGESLRVRALHIASGGD